MNNATAVALSDYIAYVAGNDTNVGTLDTVYPSLDVDVYQVTPDEYCPAVHWTTAVGHHCPVLNVGQPEGATLA